MSSTIFFFFFIPLVSFILLIINIIFAPRNSYMGKNNTFNCGFSSFSDQNRTQFSIAFFIFGLLFLLFDLEIVLVYPYLVSAYVNELYGLAILLIFLLVLVLGFVFELGKKALTIDSKQSAYLKNNLKKYQIDHGSAKINDHSSKINDHPGKINDHSTKINGHSTSVNYDFSKGMSNPNISFKPKILIGGTYRFKANSNNLNKRSFSTSSPWHLPRPNKTQSADDAKEYQDECERTVDRLAHEYFSRPDDELQNKESTDLFSKLKESQETKEQAERAVKRAINREHQEETQKKPILINEQVEGQNPVDNSGPSTGPVSFFAKVSICVDENNEPNSVVHYSNSCDIDPKSIVVYNRSEAFIDKNAGDNQSATAQSDGAQPAAQSGAQPAAPSAAPSGIRGGPLPDGLILPTPWDNRKNECVQAITDNRGTLSNPETFSNQGILINKETHWNSGWDSLSLDTTSRSTPLEFSDIIEILGAVVDPIAFPYLSAFTTSCKMVLEINKVWATIPAFILICNLHFIKNTFLKFLCFSILAKSMIYLTFIYLGFHLKGLIVLNLICLLFLLRALMLLKTHFVFTYLAVIYILIFFVLSSIIDFIPLYLQFIVL